MKKMGVGWDLVGSRIPVPGSRKLIRIRRQALAANSEYRDRCRFHDHLTIPVIMDAIETDWPITEMTVTPTDQFVLPFKWSVTNNTFKRIHRA